MRIEYHNMVVSTIKRQLTEGENKKDGQLQLPVVRHDLKIEFNYHSLRHNKPEVIAGKEKYASRTIRCIAK